MLHQQELSYELLYEQVPPLRSLDGNLTFLAVLNDNEQQEY